MVTLIGPQKHMDFLVFQHRNGADLDNETVRPLTTAASSETRPEGTEGLRSEDMVGPGVRDLTHREPCAKPRCCLSCLCDSDGGVRPGLKDTHTRDPAGCWGGGQEPDRSWPR